MATIWQTENFSRGLHTQPARAGGGENYAADIQNLQVDGDGFLRLRPNFRTVGPGGENITGVAASHTHLFILRGNRLYLRSLNNLDAEHLIPNTYNLRGRISIISAFRDYVVITSEGIDQGFWIDLREGETLRAYNLGIEPPATGAFTLRFVYNGDRIGTRHIYIYKISYARRFESQLGVTPPNEIFNFAESESGSPRHIVVSTPGFPLLDRDPDGEPLPAIYVENIVHSTDPQVTGVYIYRTNNVRGFEDKINASDADLDTFDYRRIGYLPRNMTAFTELNGQFARLPGETSTIESGENNNLHWADGVRYERDVNKRMSSDVKQFILHSGRIFGAAGDRVVYSDFDFGNPALWRFPQLNEIRRGKPGRIDFVASHREVLLFGGHDGLYRLTGVDPSDFDSDEISGVGPLDGYNWSTFKNSLGFVGSRGLYLTDASSVELLSEKALDGFFDAKIVQDGAVLFFEDDTMLFFVRLQSVGDEDTTNSFFLFDDQHWVRWAGETATQFASNAGRFYVAGNSKLKQIQWRAGENTDADLPWVWESNLIHGQAQGAGNLTKRFAELLLSAAEGIDVTLKTWVDTQQKPTEREFTTRDDLYFQRIPIERIGKRLRFRLEGTGPVTIRGIQIEGEV